MSTEQGKNAYPQKIAVSPFSRFLTRIGGAFLAPDATFKQIIADRIGFWEPFLLVLLIIGVQMAVIASFSYRIGAALADSFGSLGGGIGLGFFNAVMIVVFFVAIVCALLVWFIAAGIAHISARYIFRGRGSFVRLFKLYGYSIIPCSLQLLGTVLLGLSWILFPVFVFLDVVTVFWVMLLATVAVKQNYNIDTGKAFISSFICPMLICLIIAGLSWLWMWLIMNSFTGGFV
jgi:hypothetical protein